jgi:hypothetical protein
VVAVGGSGRSWADGVAEDVAGAGAVVDLVVAAIPAAAVSADSEAAVAEEAEPPAVGERAS